MRRRTFYLCAAGTAIALASLCIPAAGADLRLQAQAQPQRLAVGSAEPCAITVQVTDAQGAPVPDGTAVTFITTLGTIDPQAAATSGGIARAELRSTIPGAAEVSVLVAGQRETVAVEFRGAAPAAQAKSPPMIRIHARYVAYSADYDCITAASDARAQHGDLAIEARNIQYEVTRGVLKAQHDVRVQRSGGGPGLEGDRLCYYVARRQGTLLRARDAVERVAFDAENLGGAAADAAPDADFAPVDSADTRTWIVARDVIVFPSERIQFTDASLYVGNKRMFSLPHYVAPLRGERALLNQLLSFSSSGGINLDLPFYYAADSAHAGALHLRHRAASGYGFGAPGWSLGLAEQYRLSANSTGVLAVDDVTENTRSMRLDHELDLGARGRVNMGLNYYRYSPDYPGALTGRAFYSRRLQGADLDVIALGSSVGSLTNWSLDANMRWGGREIGRSGVGYDVTTNMGYGGGQLGYGGGLCLGGGLGVSPPAWEITKSTSATLDLTQQVTWAQIGSGSTTFDARAALRQGLGGLGSMSLSYSYNLSRGGYYSSYGREQLTLNAYLSQGAMWNASGYASYSLDREGLFASGGASYRLPIGERGGELPWRLDLRGSYTKFGTSRAMNSRVAIGRALGRYEALLCWSPTAGAGYGGYGYGYGAGKTFWIELAPRGW